MARITIKKMKRNNREIKEYGLRPTFYIIKKNDRAIMQVSTLTKARRKVKILRRKEKFKI